MPDRPSHSHSNSGPARGRLLLSLLVSAALLGLLIVFVDRTALLATLQEARLPPLGVAVLACALMLWTRAMRFRAMLIAERPRLTRWSFIRLVSAHQIVFTLLPSGLGDASFPWIARRYLGLGLSEAAPALVLSRLQDLVVLAAFAVIGMRSIAPGSKAFDDPLLSPSVVGVVFLSVLALYHADRVVLFTIRVIRKILARLRLERSAHFSRIADSIESAQDWLTSLSRKRLRLSLSLWSLASWCISILLFSSLFRAFGSPVEPLTVILVVAGVNLAGALSLATIGGLGVSEIGMAAVLVATGMPTAQAATLSLVVRPSALLIAVLVPAAVEIVARMSGERSRAGETTGNPDVSRPRHETAEGPLER